MTVSDLKSALACSPDHSVTIRLPDGGEVPAHFHLTEVGFVKKEFIDCGGTIRTEGKCVLQVWVANDIDHRVDSTRFANILEHGRPVLPTDALPVEMEYNSPGLTLYSLEQAQTSNGRVLLTLAHRETDCLAKDVCGITPEDACAPGSGCC